MTNNPQTPAAPSVKAQKLAAGVMRNYLSRPPSERPGFLEGAVLEAAWHAEEAAKANTRKPQTIRLMTEVAYLLSGYATGLLEFKDEEVGLDA